MQDHAHHDHVGLWQRILEKIPAAELEPVLKSERRDVPPTAA